MSFTETFTYTAGQTDLYAYPASGSYALSSTPWNDNRVLATELVAGYYTVTMDEAKSAVWSVFDGATVPTTHDDAIVTIRYEAPVSLAGVGPRTVMPTVTLAGLPAVGAVVRMTKSDGSSFRQDTTNISGKVTFNMTDGIWSVAITYDGAKFGGASLTVDGDESPTYALTAVTPSPPAAAGLATGTVLCINSLGSPAANTDLSFKLVKGPGAIGKTYNNPEFRGRSDESGIVELTTFIQGATYRYWRTGRPEMYEEFLVPVEDNFELPELVVA